MLESLTADKLAQSGLDNFQQLSATGSLPHADVGKVNFDKLDVQASNFVATLQQRNLKYLEPVEVNMQVNGKQVLGWIKHLTVNGLLFYRPAKITAKDKLVAWIHHVVMSSMGRPVATCHIGLSAQFEFSPLSLSDAGEIMAQWIDMY